MILALAPLVLVRVNSWTTVPSGILPNSRCVASAVLGSAVTAAAAQKAAVPTANNNLTSMCWLLGAKRPQAAYLLSSRRGERPTKVDRTDHPQARSASDGWVCTDIPSLALRACPLFTVPALPSPRSC